MTLPAMFDFGNFFIHHTKKVGTLAKCTTFDEYIPYSYADLEPGELGELPDTIRVELEYPTPPFTRGTKGKVESLALNLYRFLELPVRVSVYREREGVVRVDICVLYRKIPKNMSFYTTDAEFSQLRIAEFWLGSIYDKVVISSTTWWE